MTSMQEFPFPLERKLIMYLQYHHNALHLEILEFGVQWIDLNFNLKKLQIFMSNEDFILVENVPDMSRTCPWDGDMS